MARRPLCHHDPGLESFGLAHDKHQARKRRPEQERVQKNGDEDAVDNNGFFPERSSQLSQIENPHLAPVQPGLFWVQSWSGCAQLNLGWQRNSPVPYNIGLATRKPFSRRHPPWAVETACCRPCEREAIGGVDAAAIRRRGRLRYDAP